MRGAQSNITAAPSRTGIIPAYAGSTEFVRDTAQRHWDHPRVCGEHCTVQPTSKTSMGSSPRMRGALRHDLVGERANGIIPAYAGSTIIGVFYSINRRDHPRVCGEHLRSKASLYVLPGSSPRMRGALRACASRLCRHGIIPAYAGSTHHLALAFQAVRDHPRVCGEHYYGDMTGLATKGSSPRMRGARRWSRWHWGW